MGNITADSLIQKASSLVDDYLNAWYPKTEFLDWLNDGQNEIALIRPQSFVINGPFQLSSSSAKQRLPSDAQMLVSITRNAGASGDTIGPPIRLVSREVLDTQVPGWGSDANTTGQISNYCYDPRDPKTFYVFPMAPVGSHYVELVYSALPTRCDFVNSPRIALDDIFANAIVDYMIYRAAVKKENYSRATAHYTAFSLAVGVRSKDDLDHNPNLVVNGFNPQVVGQAKA